MKGQTVHLPKRAWRLGLFFIGILLAGGVLLMYKGNDAVAQGIAKKDGILTAEQVKVSFQSVSGKMVNEAVQESQEVKAGDILMQLDSTDVDLDIAKTQAQIAQLDAQIQSMEGTIAIGFAQTDTSQEESRRQIDQQRAPSIRRRQRWSMPSAIMTVNPRCIAREPLPRPISTIPRRLCP